MTIGMPKTSESKSKKTKTETATTVPEKPTVEPPTVTVVEQPVELSSSSDVEDVSSEILFNKLSNQFQDVLTVMKTLHSNLKVLQREVLKERKESKKKESKQKKKSDKKRSPNGFHKPALISPELAKFLGVPEGTELARTAVTSKIIAYVKEHNLQNPERKKEIVPDAKLKELLKPADEQIVTFFNLQTFMKNHFTKSTTVAPTEVPTVV
jgi:chromatin remodeling complex protein RSC6